MAATCIFVHNPVLISMVVNQENIIIEFKKYKKKYFNVPIKISYELFYSKQPLTYFNNNIKNKYKNEKLNR